VIPHGLLLAGDFGRGGHYSPNVPRYLNAASAGLTLAHEALHSLDRAGRQFDEEGKLRGNW